jgi:hypothetical protein
MTVLEEGGEERRGVAGSVLSIAAITLLLVALGTYHREATRLGHRAEDLRQRAHQAEVRARLLGSTLPNIALPGARGGVSPLFPSSADYHLLWIVDPGDCVACFQRLGAWKDLRRHDDLSRTILLREVGRSQARSLAADLNLSSGLRWDPEGEATLRLVGELPASSAVMLLDGELTVLGVELFTSRQSCSTDVIETFGSIIGAARGTRPPPGLAGGYRRLERTPISEEETE